MLRCVVHPVEKVDTEWWELVAASNSVFSSLSVRRRDWRSEPSSDGRFRRGSASGAMDTGDASRGVIAKTSGFIPVSGTAPLSSGIGIRNGVGAFPPSCITTSMSPAIRPGVSIDILAADPGSSTDIASDNRILET